MQWQDGNSKMMEFLNESTDINSPQFKAWFGASKVVDKNGKPLPVYHGTKNDFDAFNLDYAGSNNDPGTWGTGFYFSPQIRMSKGYGNKFKRCYLSLQNPLIFGDNHGDPPSELDAVLNRPQLILTKEIAYAIRKKMISMGYDGVMQYSNGWKYPAQIVAFNPNQIKLVNGNKGTYNPNDDRITEVSSGYRQVSSDLGKLEYLGNCTEDDIVEKLFGDATGLAQALDNSVELHPNVFYNEGYGLIIKYDDDADIHYFYQADSKVKEDIKPLFAFMTESKAFRNEKMVEKYTTQELGEIFFAMMLTIHLLGSVKQAKQYCLSSLRFPKFNHIFLTSTDLANVITTLLNAREYLGKPDINLPINDIKRYLRGVIRDTNTSDFSRALFFKLQTKLRIRDGSLLTLRREIVDGEEVKNKLIPGGKLYKQLRRYEHKSDILAILQILMDSIINENTYSVHDAIIERELLGSDDSREKVKTFTNAISIADQESLTIKEKQESLIQSLIEFKNNIDPYLVFTDEPSTDEWNNPRLRISAYPFEKVIINISDIQDYDPSLNFTPYKKLMLSGTKFPLILVSQNKTGKYDLQDGNHRFGAYKKAFPSEKYIPVALVNRVAEGTTLRELKNIELNRSDIMTYLQCEWNEYTEDTYAHKGHPIKVIGKIGSYEIQRTSNGHSEIFRLWDTINKTVAAYSQLISRIGKVKELHDSAVASKYRGLGLMVKLYSFLILKKNYILWNDSYQTAEGRKLWERLAKAPTILVFAYNTMTHKATSLDPNDLFGEELLYGDSTSDLDVNEYTDEELNDARQNMSLVAMKNK